MKDLPITAEAENAIVHGRRDKRKHPYDGKRRHEEEKKLAKHLGKKKRSVAETLYPVAKSALEESGGYEK